MIKYLDSMTFHYTSAIFVVYLDVSSFLM